MEQSKINRSFIAKIFSLWLSFMLIFCAIPTTAFAAMPDGSELFINGIDILKSDNNTVVCGNGTAVYNRNTNTLTLTNATIQQGKYGIGISVSSGAGTTSELNIILVGNNIIETTSGNEIHYGIYSMGAVNISGDGSLSITTATASQSYITYGIYAWHGLTITDSTINLKDISTLTAYKGSGMDVNEFSSSLKIQNAIITADNYKIAVNVPSGDVTVERSSVTGTNLNEGIIGGNEIDNFLIKESSLDLKVSGDGGSCGLSNGYTIQIDHSDVKIKSETSNAIYTDGAITIKNSSKLDVTGYYPALFSKLDTTIADSMVKAASIKDSAIFSKANIVIGGDSEVIANGYYSAVSSVGDLIVNSGKISAISSNDMGIWARSSFAINGGEVYAKGGNGMAAIGVRYEKQDSDTTPTAKIIINSNYGDINDGKITVSDWFNGTYGNGTPWTRSWTSFIGKDDINKLAADRSNALNEITIRMKSADYSSVDAALAKVPSDLSRYTDASVQALKDAQSAVVRGKNITGQTVVDSYAAAIEAAIQALEIKPVVPSVTKPVIISGENQTVEQGKDTIFKSDANFKDFQKVLVDGQEISADNYTVKEGSTIVTLKAEYVKTLGEGKHTLAIVSTTGKADTEFTVASSTASDQSNSQAGNDSSSQTSTTSTNKNVQTGDDSDASLRLCFLVMCIGGIAVALQTKYFKKGNRV